MARSRASAAVWQACRCHGRLRWRRYRAAARDGPSAGRAPLGRIGGREPGQRPRRGALLRGVELERRGKSAAWISSGLVAHGLLRLVIAAIHGLNNNGQPAPGEIALIEAVQDWDVTERLGEISAPTLVVGGSHDALVPPRLAEATAHGIPNARLLLLRGRGHVTALLDPRAMRVTRAFLDEPEPQ